ncbi:MAG TPA: hypothetical protein VMI53_14330 [Opitutaceae bacterium]|nr:hypothetical protein [Opitutaceae bacterium]
MKSSFPLPLIVLLAGCASTPKPASEVYRGPQGPQARVIDTATPISPSETIFCRLAQVDGRVVPAGASENTVPTSARAAGVRPSHAVPAQRCLLTLEGTDYGTYDIVGRIFGMPRVEGTIPVNLQSGQEYFVKGQISGGDLVVWLEDRAGNHVSLTVRESGRLSGSERIPEQGLPDDTAHYYSDDPHPNSQ